MGANAQTSVPLFVANSVLTAAQQNISAATGVPVFATTVTRDAAFGGSNKVLAEGQLCYLESTDVVQYYTGAAWATVGPASTTGTAIFNETQASNTAGGASTANAWTKKVLNTTVANTITGCSIASSVITLTAGTYIVQANAPFFKSDEVKLKLRNTTDSTDTVYGVSGYSVSTGNINYIVGLTGYFTIAGSKNFELQYYLKTANASGLGVAFNVASISEIYATLQLTQVA